MERFWRFALIEQYQNKEIYGIYRQIFMEESISYQTELFAEMVRQKIFREVNPKVLAMNFYAPIFFLLSKYNNRPKEREEALLILKRQVSEFYRIYRKNGKTGK